MDGLESSFSPGAGEDEGMGKASREIQALHLEEVEVRDNPCVFVPFLIYLSWMQLTK